MKLYSVITPPAWLPSVQHVNKQLIISSSPSLRHLPSQTWAGSEVNSVELRTIRQRGFYTTALGPLSGVLIQPHTETMPHQYISPTSSLLILRPIGARFSQLSSRPEILRPFKSSDVIYVRRWTLKTMPGALKVEITFSCNV